MKLIASNKNSSLKRIYHRMGCHHASRIKDENIIIMDEERAKKGHYHFCKHCFSMKWDYDEIKNIAKTIKDQKVEFKYDSHFKSIYMKTDYGFWKIIRDNNQENRLFHLNSFQREKSFKAMINGSFHYQSDIKSNYTIFKLVDYIIAHDRAKAIIEDDYRKLPQSTKKQKKYYKQAKKRNYRQGITNVYKIFAKLEAKDPKLKTYSCSLC